MDCMYRTTWAKSARASKTYRWHVSHCTRKASVQSKRDGLWRKRRRKKPFQSVYVGRPQIQACHQNLCRTTRGKGCVATNIFASFAIFQMSRACLHSWCWKGWDSTLPHPCHVNMYGWCWKGSISCFMSCFMEGWCSTLPSKTCWRNAGSSFS